MSEITQSGYQSIRDFIVANWTHIELYDNTGSAVIRVSITGDSRFKWKDIDGDALLQVYGEVQGADSDIPLGTDLTHSAIWDSASGGNQLTQKEMYATQTINQKRDGMKLTHNIEVPL